MSNDYFEEFEQWKVLVGGTILAFGEIELVTLKCLERIPKDNIYKTASKLPFARRIELIIDILQPHSSISEYSNFIAGLSKAKELSQYRNLLAHNPLAIEVYEHKATGDLHMLQLIRSSRNDKKSIDLSSMKELAAEVQQLSADLWMSVAKIAERESENT